MQKAKVDVLVCFFCYGGNGGVSSVIPEMMLWAARAMLQMKGDERIDRIKPIILSDTPITMTRNRAVRIARDEGFDTILMLDSDNEPDGYLDYDPQAKPFWSVSFDFAYDRLIQGLPTVIGAPYCGPPPHPVHESGGEVPYLFEWMDNESDEEYPQRKLELLTRNEAARLRGIHPVAALPTGCCLFTTNIFDGPPKPYFDYEWNEDHSEKHSTEDVYCTRNLSLYWSIKKEIDVCFAACDSWALHYKPKKVGRPRVTPVESVAKNMRDALADPVSVREGKVQLDCTKDLPKLGQMLGPDDDCVVITEEQMAAAKELIQAEINEVEADDDTDIDEDATDVIETPVASYDGNGQDHGDKPLTYTTVGGKKVAIYDGKDFGRSLEGVEALMSWLQARRGGALEVAVIHGGTGQSTAAINAALPEGSHIYALDNFTIHGFSTIPAEQFNQTFSKEIESGRIHADNLQRKQPFPPDRQHLDCVFFEQCVTADKLEQWLPNVQPGGLIAGLGFERTQTARLVKKFAKENDLILQNSDDVWALRVTQKTKIIAEPADNDDERVDLERLAELTNERF